MSAQNFPVAALEVQVRFLGVLVWIDRKASAVQGGSRRIILIFFSFFDPSRLTNSFALVNLPNSVEEGTSRSTITQRERTGIQTALPC